VEVVECWEAYATGLWTGNKENNWTKKDICSLKRPFVLEGSGVSEGGEARTENISQAFFFWPMEPFSVEGLSLPQEGRYIYAGLSTVTAFGLQSSCKSVGYGSYTTDDMLAPLVGGVVKEGNFVLNGQVDRYCEGIPPVHLDKDVIEVAFRALKLGAGKVCQESLP
jgi:hypothetical protein